jgi:putative FmdB family regulatory protein
MPEYRYRCNECKRYFYITRPMVERNNPICCRICLGEEVERVFTIPNHNFGYSRKGDDIENFQFEHLFKD